MRSGTSWSCAVLISARRVLGKAGAAEARAGVQELRADAVVEPDAARHLLHVGADLLARSAISLMKVILVARKALAAYLISSAVRRAGEQHRRLVEVQRPVELAASPCARARPGADHDAVGMLEVADRRALAQELRIGATTTSARGPARG